MNQDMMEIHFTREDNPDPYPEELDSIHSSIRIHPEIPSGKDSLDFKLVIRYSGINPVEVYNPLYYLQFTIMTGDHFVQTGRKPPIPLVQFKSDIQPEDFNFEISGILENGRDLSIPEEINKPSLVFKAGDERIYGLTIPGHTGQEDKPLIAGPFRISFMFSVIVAGRKNGLPQSLTFKTDPVPITTR